MSTSIDPADGEADQERRGALLKALRSCLIESDALGLSAVGIYLNLAVTELGGPDCGLPPANF